MRPRALLVTSLLALTATALASIDSVAQQIASATGGVTQACPPEYAQSLCVRADGSIVRTAGVIDRTFPTLVAETWRDGPEQGISGDIPREGLTLHLIPRGDEQTLAVFQPIGAGAPAVAAVEPTIPGSVTIENPEDAYFVVLDGLNQPVRDLTTVRDGTYTIITSRSGSLTQRQQVRVGAEGLRTLTLPRLVSAPSNTATTGGGLVLPTAPGYLFLVYTANRTLVLDLSDLPPGYYDVFSYRDGASGPLAGLQLVQAGQVTRPQFNGSFTGGSTTTPAASSPTLSPTPPASSGGGQCWVNGYRRSNGTYVSGYYRRC